MMTRGGEGGKKCPKFDDVICERPLSAETRIWKTKCSLKRNKKSKDRARCPVFFVTGPPLLDVDILKVLCYIYVLFCFYGRSMLFSLIVQLESLMQ